MSYLEDAETVAGEIHTTLTSIDPKAAERFADLVDSADEIYVNGAGRSGYMRWASAAAGSTARKRNSTAKKENRFSPRWASRGIMKASATASSAMSSSRRLLRRRAKPAGFSASAEKRSAENG